MVVENVQRGPYKGEVEPDSNRREGPYDDSLAGISVRLHRRVALDRHLVSAHDLQEKEEIEKRIDPQGLFGPGERGTSHRKLSGSPGLNQNLIESPGQQTGQDRQA